METKKQTKPHNQRWMYAGIALLVLSLGVVGISNLLAHFKTGADQTNIYDLGLNLLENHNPEIKWLPDDSDIGGDINEYLREEISDSYSDAWGILNLSMAEGRDLGLRENFTERKTRIIQEAITSSQPVYRSDLKHLLKLHFISLDRQVVSFSDHKAISEITTLNNKVIYSDTSSYQVVMTLDDGKWRINKMVRRK